MVSWKDRLEGPEIMTFSGCFFCSLKSPIDQVCLYSSTQCRQTGRFGGLIPLLQQSGKSQCPSFMVPNGDVCES